MKLIILSVILSTACYAGENPSAPQKAHVHGVGRKPVAVLLRQVTELPWPDTHIKDPAYKELIRRKKTIGADLLKSVADSTPMRDPRVNEPTKVDTFTVGDLAFFLLSDFGYVDYNNVILKFISKEEIEERGVLAYFDWVRDANHRELLQEEARRQFKQPG